MSVLSLPQYAKAQIDAKLNGKASVFRPESYGAKADNTTNDTAAIQAAIDACTAAGGGIVALTTGKRYRAGGLILKNGVLITGLSAGHKWAGGPASVGITPPTGWAGGWIIDTGVGVVTAAGVIGINIGGGVVNGSSPNTGGIRIQNGKWVTVDSCAVSGTSLGSIYVSGIANIIKFNGAQNFWNWRGALSADEGAITVLGTDAWVECNQANGGMAASETVATVPADMHRCAMLVNVYTSWFIGGNGEFSECGWKIRAYESVFNGIRADTNSGLGMHIQISTNGGNSFNDLVVLANCLSPSANLVVDQIYNEDRNNTFNGIMFGPDWTFTGNLPRYGLVDAISATGFTGRGVQQYGNRYSGLKFLPGSYGFDEALRASAFSQFNWYEEGAGNPSRRPPARFSAGRSWYDTLAAKQTHSDGTNWRDSTGAIVGNLLSPRVAYAMDGTIQWDPVTSYATVALRDGSKFGRGRALLVKPTSAGVTAGSAQVANKSAFAVPVTATANYQAGLYALGPAGKSPTGQVQVYWFTAALAYISTTTAVADTAISATTGTPTLLLSGTIVAPGTAAFATVAFVGKATGLATSDEFWVGNVALMAGTGQTDVLEV